MKLLTSLMLFLIASVGFTTSVNAEEAPIVREVFICNYLPGKNMDDLMAARDYFVSQFDAIGLENEQHFVWTPYKTGADAPDFIWFANAANLGEFGQDADNYMDSPEGQASQALFDQVAQCSSAVGLRRQIYDGGEFEIDPPAIVSSSACNLREGVGMSDLEDLWAHIRGVLDGMGTEKGTIGYVTTPIVAGPNAPDVFVYAVQDSVSDWATRTAGFGGTPEGQALLRHFNLKLDCNNSLWLGQPVIPVPAVPVPEE